MSGNHAEPAPDDWLCRTGAEVVEVALLLPGRQAAALERLACSRGLTLGQLIRRLIQEYLTCHAGAEAARGEPFSSPRWGEESMRFPKGGGR
jgi:hypothetical protein